MSEAIGFLIIAILMFSFFTLVFAIGYPVYNSYVDNGHMQNMEKSFSLLSYNGNLVAMQKMMIGSTEIKMYGGTLATRDTGALSINISYDYKDENGMSMTGSSGYMNLSTLEYSKGMIKLAYVDGSVCRYDTNGAIMLEEPEITNGTGFLFIPIINLYESQASIAGDTMIRLMFMTPYYSKSSQVVGSLAPYTVTNVNYVTIKMTGDYAPCFSRYFHEKYGFKENNIINGEINLSESYSPEINLTIMTGSDVSISTN